MASAKPASRCPHPTIRTIRATSTPSNTPSTTSTRPTSCSTASASPSGTAEGFRLLPNGERLDLEISVVPAFASWPDIGQLVVEDWADVGVRAHIEMRERTPHFAMRDSGDLMIEIWNEDTAGFPFSGQPKFDVRSNPSLTLAPMSQQWINTDGAQGVPPAPELQQIMDIIDEAKVSGPERQIELAHELFRIWTDNVWEIGTVGLTPMVQGVIVANDEAAQRARDRRQRLAAAHARQHPAGAVLLRPLGRICASSGGRAWAAACPGRRGARPECLPPKAPGPCWCTSSSGCCFCRCCCSSSRSSPSS